MIMNMDISNKKLILRGQHLLDLSPNHPRTLERMKQDAHLNYITVQRYIAKPRTMYEINLYLLYRFLSDALGFSDQQITDMRVGDMFEIVEEDRNVAAE